MKGQVKLKLENIFLWEVYSKYTARYYSNYFSYKISKGVDIAKDQE